MKLGFEQFSDTFWIKGIIGYSDDPNGDDCCLCIEYEKDHYRTIREVVYYVHDLQKGWYDATGEDLFKDIVMGG